MLSTAAASGQATCPTESADSMYETILWVTFWWYATATLFMLIISAVVLTRKGNWVALIISQLNMFGYLLRCLSFASWDRLDHVKRIEICYLADCNQGSGPPVEQSFTAKYVYYGWIYYSSKAVFSLAQIGLANFLLLTVSTLSTALKVDKISRESRIILMEAGSAHNSNECIQDAIKQNKTKFDEIDLAQRRGRCKNKAVKAWAFFCSLVILTANLYSCIKKSSKSTIDELDENQAIKIDIIGVTVSVLFLFIMVLVIVIFKVLERSYSIKIKKPQLVATGLLGFLGTIIGCLQEYSGQVQLNLYNQSDC